jgi:hypothetical protein
LKASDENAATVAVIMEILTAMASTMTTTLIKLTMKNWTSIS